MGFFFISNLRVLLRPSTSFDKSTYFILKHLQHYIPSHLYLSFDVQYNITKLKHRACTNQVINIQKVVA